MTRKWSPEAEIKWLKKRNRVLVRQLGNFKDNKKIDVRVERQKWFKEGYDTAINQMKGD